MKRDKKRNESLLLNLLTIIGLTSDPSGDPGNTTEHTQLHFWGRVRERFVGRLFRDVRDRAMGLLA